MKVIRYIVLVVCSNVIDENIYVFFLGCFVYYIIEELNKYCESLDLFKVENRDSKVENRLFFDLCIFIEKDSVINVCFGN